MEARNDIAMYVISDFLTLDDELERLDDEIRRHLTESRYLRQSVAQIRAKLRTALKRSGTNRMARGRQRDSSPNAEGDWERLRAAILTYRRGDTRRTDPSGKSRHSSATEPPAE